MEPNTDLEQLLGRIFDSSWKDEDLPSGEYEKRRYDFIFHMTDWKDDLERLSELFKNPEKNKDEAASRLLMGFLYHVIPHLNAAGRILLEEVPDAFVEKKSFADSKHFGSRLAEKEFAAK